MRWKPRLAHLCHQPCRLHRRAAPLLKMSSLHSGRLDEFLISVLITWDGTAHRRLRQARAGSRPRPTVSRQYRCGSRGTAASAEGGALELAICATRTLRGRHPGRRHTRHRIELGVGAGGRSLALRGRLRTGAAGPCQGALGARYRLDPCHRHVISLEERVDAGQAPGATYHPGVLRHDPESCRVFAPAARLHGFLASRGPGSLPGPARVCPAGQAVVPSRRG